MWLFDVISANVFPRSAGILFSWLRTFPDDGYTVWKRNRGEQHLNAHTLACSVVLKWTVQPDFPLPLDSCHLPVPLLGVRDPPEDTTGVPALMGLTFWQREEELKIYPA